MCVVWKWLAYDYKIWVKSKLEPKKWKSGQDTGPSLIPIKLYSPKLRYLWPQNKMTNKKLIIRIQHTHIKCILILLHSTC